MADNQQDARHQFVVEVVEAGQGTGIRPVNVLVTKVVRSLDVEAVAEQWASEVLSKARRESRCDEMT